MNGYLEDLLLKSRVILSIKGRRGDHNPYLAGVRLAFEPQICVCGGALPTWIFWHLGSTQVPRFVARSPPLKLLPPPIAQDRGRRASGHTGGPANAPWRLPLSVDMLSQGSISHPALPYHRWL